MKKLLRRMLDESEFLSEHGVRALSKVHEHEPYTFWHGGQPLSVRYQPGELKVVVRKGGQPWAEDVRRTAGRAARLALSADRTALAADGRDLAFVTVTVTDAKGEMVPRADNRVRFSVTGPAEVVAVDNGDPTSFEPFQSPSRKAFNGYALVIVRSKPGKPGRLTLRAESDGLAGASVTLQAVRR